MSVEDYHELSPNEKRKIRECVRRECANWDSKYGCCAVLNGRCYMDCIGFQESSVCKYFEKAILPNEPDLMKLFHKEYGVKRTCKGCGLEFSALGNQRYCSTICAGHAKRKKHCARMRKMRTIKCDAFDF